jgi:butyrate kinase
MGYKIFAINPGSTSTKIALFEDDKCLFSKNVSHDAEVLKQFKEIKDQFSYRKETILNELKSAGITLDTVDAYVGRGGGLVSMTGGVYPVNDILLRDSRLALPGPHPATLGSQLAKTFADEYGKPSYVVNPPDVDELCDEARITGLKGVYRESRIHALNQKEIGIRYAVGQGKTYEKMNLIIAHIGGGISVTAHEQGRMVDSNDILNGDGPMAPTRCGSIAVKNIIRMCYSGQYTEREMKDKVTKTGGLVDLLGTSDVREVRARIENGDTYAELIYQSMIYQICKQAGAMAAVLKGKVDSIILTGGISNDIYLTDAIKERISFIAPVVVMAGEYEMEALAAGVLRVHRGEEKSKEYTGRPVWNGFRQG